MRILAIDPGDEKSAMLIYDSDNKKIIFKVIAANWECERLILFNKYLQGVRNVYCVIEMPECFGMPVGKNVLNTCRQVGRFESIAEKLHFKTHLIYRHEIKTHLCNNMRAKDSNVRQALIDKFGGKQAIGKKNSPGVLYGISKDLWSALAIAITYIERKAKK